jgi:2-furoyl-CoA dehydrogenase large subunit
MHFRTGPRVARCSTPEIIRRRSRRGVDEGKLAELKSRRDAARAQGRLYGIGYTAVVEPSVSNMGYITTVLTPAERRKAGPKNGAQATATVAIDPVGSVSVHVASVPQGQGHRTVLSQVVADVFGLTPADVRVNTEIDTAKDAWSIASGNYASRFAPAVAGTAKLAAERIAAKLARVAASQLNTEADDIVFAGGQVAIEAQSRQQGIVLPGRGPEPLVAGRAARRHRTDHSRNRVLEPAGTDRARR